MSVRLYIGNLPKDLDRKELEALFAKEVGDLNATKVVTDRKTGKCRGFGFVTVETEEQADQVIDKLNGHLFMDNALKIEKALPKSKENANSATADNAQARSNNNRRNKNNKARNHNVVNRGSQAQAAQPDPRWADELEKLKEMLLAQTQA